MASEVIGLIVAAALVACAFSQPPVRLDERHFRVQLDDGVANGWQDSVPGLPGKDYPNLTSIPETSFTCIGKTPGGYYADVETRCQVFHVCSTQGSKSSFLCPSGSIFNQRHFVCDWWYDFVCEQAPELYSLNKALNEPEPLDPEVLDPVAPLQYNSINGANNDLSLASSGYTNNLRDEANIIYEDYSSPKRQQPSSNYQSTEKSTSIVTVSQSSASTASLSSSTDNYSDSRRKESTYDGVERHPYQQRNDGHTNYGKDLRAVTTATTAAYLGRSSQIPDNVPRGFAKVQRDGRPAFNDQEATRNDNSPGFFVNNGLSDESERNKNFPLPRENNNYIDSINYNSQIQRDERNNFNNHNNRNDNFYQNPINHPLPQDNRNYVNNNNYNQNNNNIKTNDYYNNNINYKDQNNYYTNIKNNDQNKTNINNVKFEHYYRNNFDFPEDQYEHSLEASTASPRFINSSPTEDDVDRQRQREVDSADLKRKRPQHRQYQLTTPFLIREETSSVYRDPLPTISSSTQNPPFPPDRNYLSAETTPLSITTVPTSRTTVGKAKLFLGRRPTGGLPSGTGQGLPGAKILVGSNSITGKPIDDTKSNKATSIPPRENDSRSTTRNWESTSYLPPKANDNQRNGNNQYERGGRFWGNNEQSWNSGDRLDRRY